MSRVAGAGRAVGLGGGVLPLAPSTSSSTLSPLAPPFTVDRPLASAANPSPLSPPPPPAPADRIFSSAPPSNSACPRSNGAGSSVVAAAPYFVPAGGTVLSSSPTTTANVSRTDPPNSSFGSVEASRYYPYYDPALDSVNDPLHGQPDLKGSARAWNGLFDVDKGRPGRGSVSSSSWADHGPSCKSSAPLQRRATERFIEHDSFSSWHAAYNDYSSLHGHTGSECLEWLDRSPLGKYVENAVVPTDGYGGADLSSATVWSSDGSRHFQTHKPTSIIKECDTIIPSNYDGYLAQLTSCSRDHTVLYPAMTSFSGQGYVPSKDRNESFVDWTFFKEGNPSIQHVNLYKKNDDFSKYNIDVKQNEPITCQNSEGKEAHVNMTNSGNSMLRNSSEAAGSPLTLNGKPVKCLADVKSGLEVAVLSCSNASTCEKSSSPDNSMQTSLDIPDQLNVAVDSPCWKGAPVSRKYPFGFDEMTKTSGVGDVNVGDEHVRMLSYLEQDGTSACRENGKDIQLSMPKNLSAVTTYLSCADLKLKEFSGEGPEPAKALGTELPDTLEEKMDEFVEQNVRVSEGIHSDVRQLTQAENVKAISISGESILAGKNTDHETTGKCSSQREDAQMLVQAMLGLSEMLLYHHCSEADASEKCDLKLVQHVINNLETFISKSKKGITGSKYLASVAESWSYRAKSNTDKGIREDKKEDKQSNIFMGSLNDKKYENVSKRLLGNNVRDSDHDCQAFSKDFKKAFSEQDVDPAMLFYKNLWIQTEAALWSMKHDVALMKLEMENFKHLWKADCGEDTDKLKKLKNVMILPEPATSNSMSEHDLHSCIEHGGSGKVRSASSEDSSESKTVEKNHRYIPLKEDGIDASVMARLSILRSRYDTTDLGGKDERQGVLGGRATIMDEADALVKISTVTSPEIQNVKPPLDYKKASKGTDMNAIAAAGDEVALHYATNDLAVQSYKTQNHGKWLLRSGSGGTSSDWEHVLKDEFMW